LLLLSSPLTRGTLNTVLFSVHPFLPVSQYGIKHPDPPGI
jgi:hypothetical protein